MRSITTIYNNNIDNDKNENNHIDDNNIYNNATTFFQIDRWISK